MTKPRDEVMDHDYDGIREYDNPLPRWWVWMFYACIVAAFVYVPYYHFGPGVLPVERLALDMEEWKELHPEKATATEDELVAMAQNPKVMERGAAVFKTNCVACHGPDGGGLVGPNLTDNFTIHGQDASALVHVITEGVPEKGMLAWGQLLKQQEVYDVALYVQTLRGTTPATPKAPQGDPIK